MDEFTNLAFALNWVATIGAPYMVGKLLSYLAENWAKWHELPVWVKFLSPMVLSVLLSVGATLLLRQAQFMAEVSPWFTMVAVAVSGYLGTQRGYQESRLSNYGRKAQE